MDKVNKKGYVVVAAGLVINLAFGVLYSWSIFASHLIEKFNWTSTQASIPYTLAILLFAVLMIPGGKLQDKLGAKVVVTIAGVFIGSGLLLASIWNTFAGIMIGFGVISGAGIGLGYSAVTPVAIKWFDPAKKGLVTGVVVTGFGLASLYIAPMTKYLISAYGLIAAMRILGLFLGTVVVIGAQFLFAPVKNNSCAKSIAVSSISNTKEYEWKEMIKTKQFFQLWLMFAAGSLAGLMLIGHLTKIAAIQTGSNAGYILVAAVAIFNALGRPIAGIISDKIGRMPTMIILYLLQGVTLIAFSTFTNFYSLLFGAAVITFSYGAMLAVYPSTMGDFYGAKNLGFNYGLLFSAWGVGGLIGPLLAAKILDITGGYFTAYIIAASLCFGAAIVGWMIKPIKN